MLVSKDANKGRAARAVKAPKLSKPKHAGNKAKDTPKSTQVGEMIAGAAYALIAGPEDGEDAIVSLSPSNALQALRSAHSRAIAKLSSELPDDPEEQARQIGEHWRVASWFLTRRLAIEAVEMQTNKLPVAAAIATEKHLLVSNQPTAITASLNVSTTADDLMKRITGAQHKDR